MSSINGIYQESAQEELRPYLTDVDLDTYTYTRYDRGHGGDAAIVGAQTMDTPSRESPVWRGIPCLIRNNLT